MTGNRVPQPEEPQGDCRHVADLVGRDSEGEPDPRVRGHGPRHPSWKPHRHAALDLPSRVAVREDGRQMNVDSWICAVVNRSRKRGP